MEFPCLACWVEFLKVENGKTLVLSSATKCENFQLERKRSVQNDSLPEELIVTASELVMLDGSSGVMIPSAGGAMTDCWFGTMSRACGTLTADACDDEDWPSDAELSLSSSICCPVSLLFQTENKQVLFAQCNR